MYTLQFIESRHSVRSFDTAPLDEAQIRAIKAELSEINSFFPGTRFQLFCNDDSPFRGRLGGYGVFRNASNYIAAVMDTGVKDYAEIAGFCGEKVVLKALSKSVASCFVGGTYSAANIPAQTRAGEKIIFIIALGHPDGRRRVLDKAMHAMMHRRQMDWRQFYDSSKAALPLDKALERYPLLEPALQGVACAPSAVNRRPARIWVDTDGTIHAGVADTSGFALTDLGIAKFNFAAIFGGEWTWGNGSVFLPFDSH